jgi:SsrA-binding protein
MAKQKTQQTQPNKPSNVRRDPVASGERDATQNRVAAHNYFLSDKFEAGIVLRGAEVKSVRAGQANLTDAYGLLKDGEIFLLNAHIGSYQPASIFNSEPLRTRKLLVKKADILKLATKLQQKGMTLIPTRMYFSHGRVKVEMAMAKGKQLWDKRDTERARTADKEAREAIRSRKARE